MIFWAKNIDVSVLIGKVLTKVEMNDAEDEIHFYTENGLHYRMKHDQDCCENVSVEDIVGELDWLVGTPVVMAECITNSDDPVEGRRWQPESYTWTYYKFATIKGYVTIRWFGESNGYYSEQVDFVEVK